MNKPVFGVCPSNQPWWRVSIPWLGKTITVSEQIIQLLSSQACVDEFKRQGYEAKMFFVPGESTGWDNNNIPELKQVLAQTYSWLLGFPPDARRCISLHSNSGPATPIYIYPQLCLSADMAMGKAQAAILARRVGGVARTPAVRTLLFMLKMRQLGAGRAILHETGQHQYAAGAAHLYQYAVYHGIMIARTWLEWEGLPYTDGRVPAGVAVPPGSQFDRYRPSATPAPTPTIDVFRLPLLRSPATRAVYADGLGTPCPLVRLVNGQLQDAVAIGGVINAPIHYLHWKLGTVLGYKVGKDVSVYDEATEAAVRLFQARAGLLVDGIVGRATWKALIEAKA